MISTNLTSCSAQWAIDLLAARRYKKYLAVSDTGTVRIDRAAIKAAGKYDGKWVLETNDDIISLEDAAHGYRGLMVIERCFRSLKRTQIKMMPMYHWLPRRIEAHVKICILALLIERIAEIKCDMPWSQIKQSLQSVQATQFQTPGHVFFQLNELAGEANRLLEKLAVPLPARVFGIKHTPKTTAIV
jgi:transposase